jgi:AcrR family transcriptional regulator
MARPIPPDRFAALIDAATATFVAQGYSRTQMQDVADAMGVAKGTVYAVVSGKDALLLACVRFADGLEPAPDPSSWPLPSPSTGELVELVARRLGEVDQLALRDVADGPAGETAVEMDLVVSDLMRRLVKHRRAIKLVDRCAPELPELAELWFGDGRFQLVTELRDYLGRRAEHGLLRDGTSPGHWDVVARTIVETCALWAVHLEWDPAPAKFRTSQSIEDVARTLSALFTSGVALPTKAQE